MKYEGRNYFEPDEPWNKRLIEPHDFEMLQEMLGEAQVAYRKEQIRFYLWLDKQRELGVNAPDMEVLETYKDKEILQKAKKKWRRDAICMEMYLEVSPYAIIHGDYTQWEDVYEQRYKNPERTFSDEKFK